MEVEAIINRADEDGNGSIDFPEFKRFFSMKGTDEARREQRFVGEVRCGRGWRSDWRRCERRAWDEGANGVCGTMRLVWVS